MGLEGKGEGGWKLSHNRGNVAAVAAEPAPGKGQCYPSGSRRRSGGASQVEAPRFGKSSCSMGPLMVTRRLGM